MDRRFLAVLTLALGLGVGLLVGVLGSRRLSIPDAGLAMGLAFVTWIVISVIEKAYFHVFAPRTSRLYGEELRECMGGLLDASLRVAEWRHALAHMLDRMPREFVDTMQLGSELGYVVEREYWLRAEAMGLVQPMCWRERRGVDVPSTVTSCGGFVEAEAIVESIPAPPTTPSFDRLLPPSGSVSTLIRRVSNAPPSSSNGTDKQPFERAFAFRGGRVVPIARVS